MATNPDEHGRYRVRSKTAPSLGVWSTRVYDPERHALVANAHASDSYGNALPPLPYRPKNAPADLPGDADARSASTTKKEDA